MPELPDVEAFRRVFAGHAVGKRIRAVSAVDRSILRDSTAQGIGRALKGRCFDRPERHGKLLICPTDGSTLVFHFGVTGSLVWSGEEPRRHAHDRLVLELDDGELRYRSMRKLGGIWPAKSGPELERIVGELGPDWLGVSRQELDELLAGRRGSIKSALMDQRLAAGLGNLTADEALWQARIDPRRRVSSVTDGDRDTLHRKIGKVLRESVPHGLVPAKRAWLTGARNRRDPSCPRCGAPLRRVKVGGRTTMLCPREQG